MAMKGKSVSVDGGKNIDVPTKPDANVNALTKKVKAAVEGESGEKYSQFTAVSYLKIDGNYIVKINVGGNKCVHAKFIIKGINPQLVDLQEDMSASSPLKDF